MFLDRYSLGLFFFYTHVRVSVFWRDTCPNFSVQISTFSKVCVKLTFPRESSTFPRESHIVVFTQHFPAGKCETFPWESAKLSRESGTHIAQNEGINKEKLVKHFTQFMSTFEGPLPRNSISKYFTEFATPFFLPHLSVLIIIMSHFYCTTIILQVPLQNHFSNTSPKSLFI